MDSDACWRVFTARDRRFDGRLFAAVTSTGIYCRPGCPARLPRRENVRFYGHPAAAQADGFRPCLRCRPDASPGTPAWVGTSATVSRALRLIAGGALDGAPLEALASRLGVSARHLTRLFQEHVGVAPGEVARTRRVHFARQLLGGTALSIADVAFAAGFGSVRRFNEAVRAAYRATPGELRRGRAGTGGASIASSTALTLELPYRPPLDWNALRDFLGARALSGVEVFDADGYRRVFEADGVSGVVSVQPIDGHAALRMVIDPPQPAVVLEMVTRVRRLFDLDADPDAIGSALSRDPAMRALVRSRPGLRAPGAWDGFEMAVRAIAGQQVSVAAATTFVERMVARFGRGLASAFDSRLTHLFPTPETLAAADPGSLGVPRARGEAICALAASVAAGEIAFGPGASLEATLERLARLPGFGPWTAHYVAMRACGEPDAFPAGDLGVRRALGGRESPASEAEAERRSETWRPWRAYAAMHLWTAGAASGTRQPRAAVAATVPA